MSVEYPSRIGVGDSEGVPCRVVGIDMTLGADGTLRIDRVEPAPDEPIDATVTITVDTAAITEAVQRRCRCSVLPVGERCTAVVGDGVHDDTAGIQALIDTAHRRVAAQASPSPRDEDWPAQGSTCAHVCGPDPGHVCDARATTTLQHPLPSGGTRTLPLCRPCAAAEHAAAAAA